MEAFVETMDEPKRKERSPKKAPLLGNSWAKEGNGRENLNNKNRKKKDLRYWGVGSVDGAVAGEKTKKKKPNGLEKALMGVENPFEGF